MSTAVKIENISKQYLLKHSAKRNVDFRENLASGFKSLFQKNRQETTEEFWALKNVGFEIEQGDRVGIIGRNGAGKSTLLKIISRIVEPDSGKISIKGRIASLLEVGTGFHPELSGRENIYLNGAILGMSRSEIKSNFDAIVDFSGVEKFIDTPVKRYSSGMYVRLAFAVAAHLQSEILILDEVLAVGDAEFQKKCIGKMRDVSNSGRTIIFVSHTMSAIRQICNTGILLKSGEVQKTGSIGLVIEEYQKLTELDKSDLENTVMRDGNGWCRVTDIKITNDRNVANGVFKLGDKIQFKITLKKSPDKKADRLRIIIGIYNSFGESYLRFDSKQANLNYSMNAETMEVTCAMEEHINISPGNYFLNIAVMQDELLLDYLQNIKGFNLENIDYFNTGRNMQDEELAKVFYKHSWSSFTSS